MRTLSIAAAAVLAALIATAAPAEARVCSYDLRIGGADAVRDYSINVHLNGPRRVALGYFGAIREIQIHRRGLLYYRGAPVSSFDAPGSFTLLVLKGNPGDVVRLTMDWPYPPTGCA